MQYSHLVGHKSAGRHKKVGFAHQLAFVEKRLSYSHSDGASGDSQAKPVQSGDIVFKTQNTSE